MVMYSARIRSYFCILLNQCFSSEYFKNQTYFKLTNIRYSGITVSMQSLWREHDEAHCISSNKLLGA